MYYDGSKFAAIRERSEGVILDPLDGILSAHAPTNRQPYDHLVVIVDGPVVLGYSDQCLVVAGRVENDNILVTQLF